MDPPYSKEVHEGIKAGKVRNHLPDIAGHPCRKRRTVDFGFGHLTDETRRGAAHESARLAMRWTLVFSDLESCHLWRGDLAAAGLRYVRTPVWHRVNGSPQYTGDRPGAVIETITAAHPPTGRTRWNGGGKAGFYEHNVVANQSGHRSDRVHTTQKPIELMLALVADFSDADEVVLDPFAGSGTTLAAALRLGRRAIGIELDPKSADIARTRCLAEEQACSYQGLMAGQGALFT